MHTFNVFTVLDSKHSISSLLQMAHIQYNHCYGLHTFSIITVMVGTNSILSLMNSMHSISSLSWIINSLSWTPQLSHSITTIKILAVIRLGFWLCQVHVSRYDGDQVGCRIICRHLIFPISVQFVVSAFVMGIRFSTSPSWMIKWSLADLLLSKFITHRSCILYW